MMDDITHNQVILNNHLTCLQTLLSKTVVSDQLEIRLSPPSWELNLSMYSQRCSIIGCSTSLKCCICCSIDLFRQQALQVQPLTSHLLFYLASFFAKKSCFQPILVICSNIIFLNIFFYDEIGEKNIVMIGFGNAMLLS